MNPFELSAEQQFDLVKQVTNSNDLTELAQRIEDMELELKNYKKFEEDYKKSKEELRQKMIAKGVKTWTLNSGTKFTATEDTPSKDNYVTKFCELSFKNAYPDLYKEFCKKFNDKTSPRKGSLRITLSKEKK